MGKLDELDPPRWSTDAILARGDLIAVARRIIGARRALQQALSVDLTHEPTLDILLALFVAHDTGPVGFRSLAASTTIPLTGVERWLRALEAEGLVTRAGTAAALTPPGHERVTAALKGVIRSQMNEQWD
ncbi:hypothetical protein [Sphingomonas sp. Leaf343]|uniref:hypothetical protein n=1 Tax=Sphingomonas sp. Leaf343 TaxID=1736345 RepID=UPI0006F20105|nr:hypothetical protein [Sphingomonas sp. Leaf343]KQR80959.1 hypothetical protein ASG07_14435 [Sphingomonas sp. Leaf343]